MASLLFLIFSEVNSCFHQQTCKMEDSSRVKLGENQKKRPIKPSRKGKRSTNDGELNLVTDMGDTCKRKIQNTTDDHNPYVKLMKLGPKQMKNVLEYNIEEDQDHRDETFPDIPVSESVPKTINKSKALLPNTSVTKLLPKTTSQCEASLPDKPVNILVLKSNSQSKSVLTRASVKELGQNTTSQIKAVLPDISSTASVPQTRQRKALPVNKQKQDIVIEVAPCQQTEDELSILKRGNVKRLKTLWEGWSAKTQAQPHASSPVEIHSCSSTAVDRNTNKIPLDSQDSSTPLSEFEGRSESCKTPAKMTTPATPKSPKSPKEVLLDYTKTVHLSKSKSPLPCKSPRQKNSYETEESPEKWGKKSFRKLFPDPPTVDDSSPDVLPSPLQKKKKTLKKRSLLSLNPAVYSQFFSPPPDDSAHNTTFIVGSDSSVEAPRSVPDDSFSLSDLSVEEPVSLPDIPSCHDSLNGLALDMSSILTNNSELETSVLDNSTVNRAITKTVSSLFGNISNLSLKKPNTGETADNCKIGDVNGDADYSMNELTDSVERTTEKSKNKASLENHSLDDNKDIDDIRVSLLKKTLDLTKAAVKKNSNAKAGNEESHANNQDLFFPSSIGAVVQDSRESGDAEVKKDDQRKEEPRDDETDDVPAQFSPLISSCCQPPILSPHPSVLQKLNVLSSEILIDKEDLPMPDLISPTSSLKPPVLSPYPASLEVLKPTDNQPETMPCLTPQVIADSQLPSVRLNENNRMITDVQGSQDCLVDLMCYEEHDKENIPENRNREEKTANQPYSQDVSKLINECAVSIDHTVNSNKPETGSQLSPSYLNSSQLMWSPTPVEEPSTPRVLTNRKSVKRPRRLIFDRISDQEQTQSNAKVMKLANQDCQDASKITRAINLTSSIGKVSTLLTPQIMSNQASVHSSISTCTAACFESPSSCPISSQKDITSNQPPASADPQDSGSKIQIFKGNFTELAPSVISAPPGGISTHTSQPYQMFFGPDFKMYPGIASEQRATTSCMPMLTPAESNSKSSKTSQMFFGPDFKPNLDLKMSSSVLCKQYKVDTLTNTKKASHQDLTSTGQTTMCSDSRATPEGAEKTGSRFFSSYIVRSEQSLEINHGKKTSKAVCTNLPMNSMKDKRPAISLLGSCQNRRPVTSGVSSVQENKPVASAMGGIHENRPVDSALISVQVNRPATSAVNYVKGVRPVNSVLRPVEENRPEETRPTNSKQVNKPIMTAVLRLQGNGQNPLGLQVNRPATSTLSSMQGNRQATSALSSVEGNRLATCTSSCVPGNRPAISAIDPGIGYRPATSDLCSVNGNNRAIIGTNSEQQNTPATCTINLLEGNRPATSIINSLQGNRPDSPAVNTEQRNRLITATLKRNGKRQPTFAFSSIQGNRPATPVLPCAQENRPATSALSVQGNRTATSALSSVQENGTATSVLSSLHETIPAASALGMVQQKRPVTSVLGCVQENKPVATVLGSRQENRAVSCVVKENLPISTSQQVTTVQSSYQEDYQTQLTIFDKSHPHSTKDNQSTLSLFDHMANNFKGRFEQQLTQRQNSLFSDVTQNDMRKEIENLLDDAYFAPSSSNNVASTSYQTSSQPSQQIGTKEMSTVDASDLQPLDLIAEGAAQTSNFGWNPDFWQQQLKRCNHPPYYYISALCPRLQDLKPYCISGWISSTYLLALMNKTDLLNDMFSNALDANGDVKEWVVDNCRKSTPAILARDLVFRILTLGELEKSVIIFNNMTCLSRKKMSAIRRSISKQFPRVFDEKVWRRKCLPYIKASVMTLFKVRVQQVQNFWLMHDTRKSYQ